MKVNAQDFAFTQYPYSPLQINPTSPSSDNNLKVLVHYRMQYRSPNPNFYTPSFSFLMPFINKETYRRWGGIGIGAISDQTGNFPRLINQGASLSYAHNLYMGKGFNFSLGLQLGLFQYSVGTDKFSTGNQYDGNSGYNPNAPSGENFNAASTNYADLSSGLWLSKEDSSGNQKYYFGISLIHLNKPTRSLIGEQAYLPIKFNGQLGANFFPKPQLSISPDVLFSYQGNAFYANGGVKVSYHLQDTGKIKSSISLIPRYFSTKVIGAGIEYKYANWFVAFNYDIFLNKSQSVNNITAIEVAVGYKKSLFKSKPYKPRSNYTVGDIKRLYKVETTEEVKEELKKGNYTYLTEDENDTTWHKSADYKFELSKQFRFGFNDTKLDNDAKSFADEIFAILKDNKKLRLKVIGYTDNVGTEQVNQVISTERAKAFTSYLQTKGIPDYRLKAEGKGESEALNDNRTSEERAKNRRIVFIIY